MGQILNLNTFISFQNFILNKILKLFFLIMNVFLNVKGKKKIKYIICIIYYLKKRKIKKVKYPFYLF